MDKPISTPSYEFSDKNEYGIVEYIKTSLWLHLIEQATSRAAVDKAMQHYYTKWKFKHPYPEDMKAAFEEATGNGFNAAFSLLDKTGALQ